MKKECRLKKRNLNLGIESNSFLALPSDLVSLTQLLIPDIDSDRQTLEELCKDHRTGFAVVWRLRLKNHERSISQRSRRAQKSEREGLLTSERSFASVKSEKDRLYVATKLLDSVLLVANHSEGDLAHDGASSNDPDLE